MIPYTLIYHYIISYMKHIFCIPMLIIFQSVMYCFLITLSVAWEIVGNHVLFTLNIYNKHQFWKGKVH